MEATLLDRPSSPASSLVTVAVGHNSALVSAECPEEELFATVQRLIDASRPTAWSASRSADRTVPSRMRQHRPASTHLRLVPPLRIEQRGGLAPGALRRVREYIDQHCSERISTDNLANVAGLSPGHFNRAFKQSTGSSPHQYVTHKRVAKATELLKKTCRALADIALEVGFADQSHFSRTYVAVTGETPSACRRRHR